MKKRFLSFFLTLCMLASLLPARATGGSWAGEGTSGAPYEIADEDDLKALSHRVNAGETFENTYFELTGDVDLNSGYTFAFAPETGLVAVNDGASDAFYLGTGICGTLEGNQFASAPSTAGGYYYLNGADGLYTALSSAAGAAARSYVSDADARTVTVYGADAETYDTLDTWTPIGTESNPFSGNFNGGGKTVEGIYINNTAKSDQGLFGYADNAAIRDLYVDGFITGGNRTGGVAGYIFGTVERCFNSAAVCGVRFVGGIAGDSVGGDGVSECGNRGAVSGVERVGGILGTGWDEISGCANSGAVNGKLYTGGILGVLMGGTLRNCCNGGTVTAVASGSTDTGGVVGHSEDATVQNCFNSGPVSGLSNVGGVAGGNFGAFDGIVENCYNRGGVTGSGNTGAVVGTNSGTVGYCYWLKTAEVCPTLGASGSGGAKGCGYITAPDGSITLVDTIDHTYVTDDTVKLTEALQAWVETANLAELDTWAADSVTGFPVFSSSLVPKTFTFRYYSSDGLTLLDSSTASLWRGSMLLSSYKPDEMGRVFLGWATEANSETAAYLPGSDYKPDYDALPEPKPDFLSLYAVWDYLWTGSGTADDPYLISSAQGLKELSERNETGETFSGKYFKLTQNISLNEGYTFTFDAATGLVAVNNGSADVFYLGTGIPGTESGNQFGIFGSSPGTYYDQNGGTYTAMSSSSSAGARKYVLHDDSVTVYGADTATYYTLNIWTPIGGTQGLNEQYFEGVFDGGGKTVSGLFINNTEDDQGLFGTADGAQIRNLSVAGCVIGGDYTSGIAGIAQENSSIENCTNAAMVCGTSYVGGISGSLKDGSTAENCENTGVVGGSMAGGGIAGTLSTGCAVQNCGNSGIVWGRDSGGGIVGGQSGGTVENCENTGVARGFALVGGIVGDLDEYGTVSNCRSSGVVSGSPSMLINYYLGGIVGRSIDGTIDGCSNSGTVSGGVCLGCVGGIGGGCENGQIRNCFNSGAVNGDVANSCDSYGGILGYGNGVRVINCSNTGAVSGACYIGGIAGRIGSSSTGGEGLLENCYSLGSVTGTYSSGKLAGKLDAPAKYCYWLKTAETDSYFGEISCAPVGCGYVTSADGSITPDGQSPYVTGTTVTLTEALEAWVEATNLDTYDTWVTDSAAGIPVFSSPWVPETFAFRYYSADGGTLLESKTVTLRQENMLIMSAEPEEAGKVFSGWAESANSTVIAYLPGEDYGSVYDASDPKPASLSLYAVWEDPGAGNGSVTKLFASGSSSAEPFYITDGQDPDSLENGGRDIVVNSGYGNAYTYGNPQNVGVSFTVGSGEGEIAPGQSARIVIYAYDVKELVEFDTVWLVDETLSKTYRVGQISGGANAWNSTALPLPQCLLEEGHSYHLKFSIDADVIYIRSVYLLIGEGTGDGGNITAKSVSLSYAPGTLSATASLTAAAATSYTLEYKVSARWEDNNTNQLRKAAGGITTTAAGETGTDTQSFSITPNSRFLYQLDVIVKKDSVPVAVITRVFTVYTCSYDLNGVSGTAPAGGGVLLGDKLEKPADPEAPGFAFLGWFTDVACTDAWDFGADTVSSDMILYASWIALDGGKALELSALSLDGGIASVTVQNKTDAALAASVVVAAYDSGGRMIGVKLLEVTAAKNGTQNVTADFSALSGLSGVKAFLLYGKESRPLCGSLSAGAR